MPTFPNLFIIYETMKLRTENKMRVSYCRFNPKKVFLNDLVTGMGAEVNVGLHVTCPVLTETENRR